MLVLILSREASKQLASSVMTGQCNPALQAMKELVVAGKQDYSDFVCTNVFMNTLDDGAKPKAY